MDIVLVSTRFCEKEMHIITADVSFSKFLFLFLCGYRLQAIAIIGREVMLPKGLVGLNADVMDYSGKEIREALMLYTSSHALPNLTHCTQGKDRTGQMRCIAPHDEITYKLVGLICALVLLILAVPISAIEVDYALSDEGLVSEREERIKEIRSIGLTDDWLMTDKRFVTSMVTHLETQYGGLDGYLDSIEFGEELRSRVKETLLY